MGGGDEGTDPRIPFITGSGLSLWVGPAIWCRKMGLQLILGEWMDGQKFRDYVGQVFIISVGQYGWWTVRTFNQIIIKSWHYQSAKFEFIS